jgi:hypothetical protein
VAAAAPGISGRGEGRRVDRQRARAVGPPADPRTRGERDQRHDMDLQQPDHPSPIIANARPAAGAAG